MADEIISIIDKYGTSLSETRKLMAELMPALERRRKERELSILRTPQFLTASEVKQLGLS